MEGIDITDSDLRDKLRRICHKKRIHFKKRIHKRFGINLTNHQCSEIFNSIKNDECKLISQTGEYNFIYEIVIKDKLVHVVCDMNLGILVTALLPKGEIYEQENFRENAL
jgi:hypothetical protein